MVLQNPITSGLHVKVRSRLRTRFAELESCSHESYLSLSKYLEGTPERFYSEEAFRRYLLFLNNELANNNELLKDNLNQENQRIDNAFLFLGEINKEDWHNTFGKSDDYAFMRFCDKILHPTYVKLIEGVLYPFIYLPALHSRVQRQKPTEGLDVFNCVEELKASNLRVVCEAYDNIVRNGIAHGGTIYKDKEIVYQDKRGHKRTLPQSSLVQLVDDLVDICNGCVLALKLFYTLNLNKGFQVPRQFMIEELQAETDSPWWHIDGCLTSELVGRPQLVIYARPNSRDYDKIQYSTFVSGLLCEQFAPGFHTYFFSLRAPFAWPGWATFDGIKLKELREKGNSRIEDYEGVIQNNLVFYKPNFRLPRFLGRIDTLWRSFKIHLPLALEEIRNQLNELLIVVRVTTIHRNGWRAVLKGSVVLNPNSKIETQEFIRNSCRKIVRKTLKKGRRQIGLVNFVRFLPLGYARITLFTKDFRSRRFEGFGLGTELIGTIQINRIGRMRVPDIMGSTIEIRNSYRIAWNKAWLESVAR